MYKVEVEACDFSESTTGQPDDPPPLEQACAQKCSAGSHKADQQSKSDWNDWKWQIKNRIRTFEQLIRYLPALHDNLNLIDVIKKYPLAINPYYASLIQHPDISDPIFQMCVPQSGELFNPSCLSEDPLEENEDMPVPGLVHRYQDRALVIVTTTCASYCRHCTRKRIAGNRESSISPRRLQQVTEYLLAHPEISDVVISGGDPLTMPTPAIEAVLSAIRSVKSVQVIRIGSRVPVVLPMRIDNELVDMLRKYHPLWINTHFNHPNELTPEAIEACGRLANAGIPLGNQTVLLRGVNDSPQIIEQLCRGLIRMRVRPYYLYQCDLVRGVEHFRTPLSRGIEIIEYMRGRVSGIAIPTFVVDAPHGGGKIPIIPNYIVSMSPTHTVLRNYEGLLVNYPEPEIKASPRLQQEEDKAQSTKGGVWELASGKLSIIQPLNMNRTDRRQKIIEKRKKAASAPNCGSLFEL
ncbi:MAG TPA: KamA family radical SAM protein [Sedimentisphaerales bacterium]|nr:KamA family radical SAM protein [Sedimentisphaerales bacterium]